MNCEMELIESFPTLSDCEKAMDTHFQKIESGGVVCVEKIEA